MLTMLEICYQMCSIVYRSAPVAVSNGDRLARINASDIAEYRKRYKQMCNDVTANQEKFKKDPQSHPRYPSEWDDFWTRRSEEFDKAGKDPYEHDFTREWSIYWVERVVQLDKEAIAAREKKIRKDLNLPLDVEIPMEQAAPPAREQAEVAKPSNDVPIANQQPKWIPITDQRSENSQQVSNNRDAGKNVEAPREQQAASSRATNYSNEQREQNFRSHANYSKQDRHPSPPPPEQASPVQQNSGFYEPVVVISDNEAENENTQDPVTVISVLRLLAAFEDLLGNSLGPKVVDLLSKAVALEKVRPNLADELLMSMENSVLLDTVKEKMKGLLLTGSVESFKVPAVRKVFAHVNKINHIINLKVKANQKMAVKEARQNLELARAKEKENQERVKLEFHADVMKQLATSISLQGKYISQEQLETLTNVYIEKHTPSDTPYLFGLQMGSRFPDLPQPVTAQPDRQRTEFERSESNRHATDNVYERQRSDFANEPNRQAMDNRFDRQREEYARDSHRQTLGNNERQRADYGSEPNRQQLDNHFETPQISPWLNMPRSSLLPLPNTGLPSSRHYELGHMSHPEARPVFDHQQHDRQQPFDNQHRRPEPEVNEFYDADYFRNDSAAGPSVGFLHKRTVTIGGQPQSRQELHQQERELYEQREELRAHGYQREIPDLMRQQQFADYGGDHRREEDLLYAHEKRLLEEEQMMRMANHSMNERFGRGGRFRRTRRGNL